MALEFSWDWEQKEKLIWDALLEGGVYELFDEECPPWRSMAGLGFPDYICFVDGRIFELSQDRSDFNLKPLHWSEKYGVWRVTLKKPNYVNGVRVANHSVQHHAHRFVALLHCDRPEGSRLVKFMDGSKRNIHASNLYWV